MNNIELLPWHTEIWRHLVQRLDDRRLPHALLLSGPAGTGKRQLARAFAHALLCEQRGSGGSPCGRCASCRLVAAGNHPDLYVVRPAIVALAEGVLAAQEEDEAPVEEDNDNSAPTAKARASRDITVDQIRTLAGRLPIASHRAGMRVVTLYPAEAMNAIAANALLKTLEEPTPGVVFLLASDAPHRLLPTIVSRCHRIALPIPDAALAERWLEARSAGSARHLRLAGGAPVKVAELAGSNYWDTHASFIDALARGQDFDPIMLARTIDAEIKRQDREAQQGTVRTLDLGAVVRWMQRWLHDALRLRLTQTIGYHPGVPEGLRRLASLPVGRLMAFNTWLVDAARQSGHPVNQQLFLEDGLLRYRALFDQDVDAAARHV